MSYPKWIYSAEGPRLIQSEEEHPGAGWYESPADIPADGDQTDPKDDLRAKLEAAGVKVDSRWGLARLQTEADKL